ncbi:MAG: cation transporter [Oscillospiraceae bacterium]|jgi:copper chaperone|nr:cation transporter [Oscillospiraceae bacterium]
MEKVTIKVDGMMCDRCVQAVTKAVSALPGIGGVAVDLDGGTVTVEHEPAQSPLEKIAFEIEEQGYDVSL